MEEKCQQCGKPYEATGYEGPLCPHWCPECEEELNAACGGSWIGAVYQSIKERNPYGVG